MSSISKIKSPFSKIFISVFCAVLFFSILPAIARAEIKPVHGWAWSDTIGWIQFDTGRSNLPTYNDATGALSGYAWSDNIGWIKFDGLSVNGGVGGNSAKADTGTGYISGWARACAGTLSGTCTTMDPRMDGWDGWIKFDTGRSNPAKIDFATGDFHGYAWGSDVAGWISFNCLEGSSGNGSVCGTSNYKVTIGNMGNVGGNTRDLTVNIGGSGKGHISNITSADSTSSTKTWYLYPDNTKIKLQATPDTGSRFGGWNNSANTGNCTNSKGGPGVLSTTDFANDTCTIVLDGANKTLNVTFELNNISPSSSSSSSNSGNSSTANLSVIYAGTGTGSVSLTHMGSLDGNDNGFDSPVPGSSPWDLAPNWTFKIIATPGANSSFGNWSVGSGSCDTSQGANTCILTMDTDKVVTVTFNCVSNCGGGGGGGGPTLTVDVGNGTVTVVAVDGSSPTLTCANFATCSQSYAVGTKLTLTESETGGEPFDRWTGDCSVSGGASTCSLTMDLSRSVGALFGGCACAGNSCTPCEPLPPPVPPINGACGTAHKTNGKEAPSVNLCADGSTPPISGTGPWTWTCKGSNGGTDAQCSAGKLEVIIQEI